MNSLNALTPEVKQLELDLSAIQKKMNLAACGSAIIAAIAKSFEDPTFCDEFEQWKKEMRKAS